MTIEIGDAAGRSGTLNILASSEPSALASEFIRAHGLDDDVHAALTEHIRENKEAALPRYREALVARAARRAVAAASALSPPASSPWAPTPAPAPAPRASPLNDMTPISAPGPRSSPLSVPRWLADSAASTGDMAVGVASLRSSPVSALVGSDAELEARYSELAARALPGATSARARFSPNAARGGGVVRRRAVSVSAGQPTAAGAARGGQASPASATRLRELAVPKGARSTTPRAISSSPSNRGAVAAATSAAAFDRLHRNAAERLAKIASEGAAASNAAVAASRATAPPKPPAAVSGAVARLYAVDVGAAESALETARLAAERASKSWVCALCATPNEAEAEECKAVSRMGVGSARARGRCGAPRPALGGSAAQIAPSRAATRARELAAAHTAALARREAARSEREAAALSAVTGVPSLSAASAELASAARARAAASEARPKSTHAALFHEARVKVERSRAAAAVAAGAAAARATRHRSMPPAAIAAAVDRLAAPIIRAASPTRAASPIPKQPSVLVPALASAAMHASAAAAAAAALARQTAAAQAAMAAAATRHTGARSTALVDGARRRAAAGLFCLLRDEDGTADSSLGDEISGFDDFSAEERRTSDVADDDNMTTTGGGDTFADGGESFAAFTMEALEALTLRLADPADAAAAARAAAKGGFALANSLAGAAAAELANSALSLSVANRRAVRGTVRDSRLRALARAVLARLRARGAMETASFEEFASALGAELESRGAGPACYGAHRRARRAALTAAAAAARAEADAPSFVPVIDARSRALAAGRESEGGAGAGAALHSLARVADARNVVRQVDALRAQLRALEPRKLNAMAPAFEHGREGVVNDAAAPQFFVHAPQHFENDSTEVRRAQLARLREGLDGTAAGSARAPPPVPGRAAALAHSPVRSPPAFAMAVARAPLRPPTVAPLPAAADYDGRISMSALARLGARIDRILTVDPSSAGR